MEIMIGVVKIEGDGRREEAATQVSGRVGRATGARGETPVDPKNLQQICRIYNQHGHSSTSAWWA